MNIRYYRFIAYTHYYGSGLGPPDPAVAVLAGAAGKGELIGSKTPRRNNAGGIWNMGDFPPPIAISAILTASCQIPLLRTEILALKDTEILNISATIKIEVSTRRASPMRGRPHRYTMLSYVVYSVWLLNRDRWQVHIHDLARRRGPAPYRYLYSVISLRYSLEIKDRVNRP